MRHVRAVLWAVLCIQVLWELGITSFDDDAGKMKRENRRHTRDFPSRLNGDEKGFLSLEQGCRTPKILQRMRTVKCSLTPFRVLGVKCGNSLRIAREALVPGGDSGNFSDS
jgi:hypothetical protein